MTIVAGIPWLFTVLKFASAAYIIWLAWRVAHLTLSPHQSDQAKAPGFGAGLIVHPLNPKAWAIVVAGFTTFTAPGTPAWEATAIIAACLLACQVLLHPVWTLAGAWIAAQVAGRPAEVWLMRGLAVLTVASVLVALVAGGGLAATQAQG